MVFGSADQTKPEWHHFDPLKDGADLYRAASGCEVVLCLSGVTPARAATGAPFSDNTALALAAVDAGAHSGARVLLCSSASVYGNQARDLNETSPLRPANAYGRAKVDMERTAAARARDLGVQCTSLRIGNVAGVDAVLGGCPSNFALDRFADGRTPARSYIGAQTLARVLADLLRTPALPEVLNVASPGLVEMGALLDSAARPWTPRPASPGSIARVSLDTTRLRRFSPAATKPGAAPDMVAEWHALADRLPNAQVA